MPFLFIKICGGRLGLIIVPALWFLGAVITGLLVSLVWNTFDVSSVFGAGSLSFWQCTGIGAIISFL